MNVEPPHATKPGRAAGIPLSRQIVIGIVAGCLVGWLAPGQAAHVAFIRDIFISLIRSLVAPLIFASVVSGIAGGGGAGRVGRLGFKALVYFEAATCLALAVGLVVANLAHPGRGVVIPASAVAGAALPTGAPMSIPQTLAHVFPASLVDAMARGDALQIVAFAVIFGLAVVAAGERAAPVVALCESVTAVMFRFTDLVMRLAPLGVGAAIAVTIGQQGPGVLVRLGLLVGSLYLALALFVALLLVLVGGVLKLPVLRFWRAAKAPFVLAFATASSESALPLAVESMVELGVPRHIAGFVIPTGYSFNLDGSTLYLAIASVFVAQAAESGGAPHFGIHRQLLLMATLMITSKGVAAVPRASLVVLLAAVQSFGLPPEGVTVILGVDALMDMARTSVNVLGNCMASMVVARWEGEFPRSGTVPAPPEP